MGGIWVGYQISPIIHTSRKLDKNTYKSVLYMVATPRFELGTPTL